MDCAYVLSTYSVSTNKRKALEWLTVAMITSSGKRDMFGALFSTNVITLFETFSRVKRTPHLLF